jgi:NAD(P)-dependent dehydrogenase (short-subunit alcohol dehydrogenase family)
MSGRVVWVTGASSGIGRALALALARRGDRVAASARSGDRLEQLAAEASGIRAYPLDITDLEATREVVARIGEELGPIDVAVLNAGTHHPVKAEDFKAGELARLLEINVVGTANGLEVLMRDMLARGSGRIAVVSSVAGYRGLPTGAYYGASKAALINMTEALRFDLVGRGVTIQLIDPGFVATPLTDKNTFRMPFRIRPERAAERIVQGLASDRFEITFPKRFTWLMKLLRILPYRLYFPLVARATGA